MTKNSESATSHAWRTEVRRAFFLPMVLTGEAWTRLPGEVTLDGDGEGRPFFDFELDAIAATCCDDVGLRAVRGGAIGCCMAAAD